jgi:2-keto-4-pentenoate hydratase/2-oxohepta-3-ene-1,7-dioic acid hydratase in catechol pathway
MVEIKEEYAEKPVPQNARLGFLKPAMVWAGFAHAYICIFIGSQILGGLGAPLGYAAIIDQGTWVRFGKNPPKEPVIYLKPRTTLRGPTDDIICPNFVEELDYEGELALTIGKECRKVDEDDALNYVAGYFILNDVSARDVQFIDKQYSRAKGFDTFGPCGPWLTTTDEISDPCNLRITTKVNGETRQDSSTKNLVLRIEKIICSLSKVMTLESGDIISTGTPSGTALSMSSNSKYLKHNDIVEVEIEKLGKIRNRVVFVN